MGCTFFDTHTHYNHPSFAGDLDAVMTRIRRLGVRMDAVIGYDLPSSQRALELAGEDPGHLAVTGIHPLHVADLPRDAMEQLAGMVKEGASAVGEFGLDYHLPDGPAKELQKDLFRMQLELAKMTGLPVVIHSRDAAQDTVEILKEFPGVTGVIHCYSYSPEMAEVFVKMGYYLGIGGMVTRQAAKKLPETVRRIPLSSLLLETDAPYQSPEGHRGERNDSGALPRIAEEIARLKGLSPEEVCRVTWENACRLYRVASSYDEML